MRLRGWRFEPGRLILAVVTSSLDFGWFCSRRQLLFSPGSFAQVIYFSCADMVATNQCVLSRDVFAFSLRMREVDFEV